MSIEFEQLERETDEVFRIGAGSYRSIEKTPLWLIGKLLLEILKELREHRKRQFEPRR